MLWLASENCLFQRTKWLVKQTLKMSHEWANRKQFSSETSLISVFANLSYPCIIRKQNQRGLRKYQSNYSKNSYDISYLPRQTCYKAFIFFTANTVRHDWRLVFLTLGNVHQSYFVRLATGEKKKTIPQQDWTIAFPRVLPATHFSQLHPASFFPCFSLVVSTPRAFHR